MKERPILFSAPMVRALLAGTKTQTRRVVKHNIKGPNHPLDTFDWFDAKGRWVAAHGRGFEFGQTNAAKLCRYGQPGDRLWVRETWAAHWMYNDLPANMARSQREDLRPTDNRWFLAGPSQIGRDGSGMRGKWRPSIHMPRWASRITLEITGVRVERLQDISEADALAEGISTVRTCEWDREHFGSWQAKFVAAVLAGEKPPCGPLPSVAYRALWESLNGPGSWDANPWVWVLEFKRVEGGAQ